MVGKRKPLENIFLKAEDIILCRKNYYLSSVLKKREITAGCNRLHGGTETSFQI